MFGDVWWCLVMLENDYNYDHAHVKLARQNIQQMSLAPWLCGKLGMPTKVFFNLDWFASKHLSSMWVLFFLRTSWLFCRCKHGYVWKVLQFFVVWECTYILKFSMYFILQNKSLIFISSMYQDSILKISVVCSNHL